MPVETRMWEIDGENLRPTQATNFDEERLLQKWLQDDIGILDDDLLVIGKELTTDLGDRLDLLAIDPAGQLVVIELKKGRTPRQVVAQVLGYTAWVADLSYDEIARMAADYLDTDFADAFQQAFDEELPDLINESQRMIVVAGELDPYVERSLRYLSEEWGVDINAVFFRCFEGSGDHQHLVRSWLEGPSEVERRKLKSGGWTASTVDELREMAGLGEAEEAFDLMLEYAEQWGMSQYPASVKLTLRGVFPNGRRRKVFGLYPKYSENGRLSVEIPMNRVTDFFEVDDDTVEEALPESDIERSNRYLLSIDDIEQMAEALDMEY